MRFLYFGNVIGKLFFLWHAQNIREIFKFRDISKKCIRVPGPLQIFFGEGDSPNRQKLDGCFFDKFYGKM